MAPPGSLPTGQERVKLLYEEYVHYSWLKKVWDKPLTDKPELEPCCAAAFHGIELAFLLLAEFITDKRTYVAKRPRIEAMALDIRAQVQLLAEIVDGELEEEGHFSWASLTQDFPFEGCPPTTTAPACSPGLARLIEAMRSVKAHVSFAQLNSLNKIVIQITSAFQASFARWTVGLGIEHQLNTLLALLDLKMRVPEHRTNLDYMAMFRPQVVEATLTHEQYDNDEDFFFRTIHLGTECWMYIANNRTRSAAEFANRGDWHIASARIMQAARILHYLGDHIMTLTRMNLRDYLQLKVQLEGTSGAGSSQVRAIRGLVTALIQPLSQQARTIPASELVVKASNANGDLSEDDAALLQGVMTIYINCEKYPGLYNYAKALEDIESALLGGFYYKHFCLATNVIGSEARGTMRRAVAALKSGYERPVFPVLDAARCALGARYDAELSHLKGKMMDEILNKYATLTGTSDERQTSMIPPSIVRLASATPHLEQILANTHIYRQLSTEIDTSTTTGDPATPERRRSIADSVAAAAAVAAAVVASPEGVAAAAAASGPSPRASLDQMTLAHVSPHPVLSPQASLNNAAGTGSATHTKGLDKAASIAALDDDMAGVGAPADAAIAAAYPAVSARGLCPFMSLASGGTPGVSAGASPEPDAAALPAGHPHLSGAGLKSLLGEAEKPSGCPFFS